MIARRHVFYIGGYDPIVPDTQLARFRRSLSSFEKTWHVSTQVSDQAQSSTVSATWQAETSAPNWQTRTSFEMLRWDDLILKDHERGMWSRLGQSTLTMMDFIVTGTLVRFIGSSWKYAGFFLFPYLWTALFVLCGAAVGTALVWLTGLGGIIAAMTGGIVGVAVFVALLHWLGPRRPINHVFDDWIFSREFVYGKRMEMEKRLDAFAATIVAKVAKADVEEIVIVGHCLGAALVMESVARALRLDPELGKHGPTFCILTVGATIPKFSLHPKGERVRQSTKTVAADLSLRWAEYHARDDAISFYRFDPVTLRRVSRERSAGRPNIRRVQIHDMIRPEVFKRDRFNFMRMHYQFVMGNDRRTPYDYCMIICGPLSFDEITAPEGGVTRFGADGSLLATTAPQSAKMIPLTVPGASVNAA